MPNEHTRPAAGHGPGSTLAQARADLGLSHEEVAERLHLSARQIVALEADDYDRLPGPTYVRGYLRSYAELLGLSPGPLLESYAQLAAAQPPPNFATIAPKEHITSEQQQVKFATYVVAAVLIGLVIAWWQSREGTAPTPGATSGPDAPDFAAPPVDSLPLVEPDPDMLAAPVLPSPLGPVPPPIEAPAPGEPMPGVPAPSAATAPAPVQSVSPPPVAAAPPTAVGPRVRLVIHADEESWVDVRDARQNKLLYETVVAGRSVSVEGPAPLSVFLGNVAGVRVEFNGRAYDALRHQRGQVARFTLGRDLTED
ncbi:MAG TPA: RodZ domain-containing protein [Acidiferrobacterales bacterium]